MAERILIVEDDPATREGLALLLQTLGYRVTAAPDGATALAALREEPPDVMLLDLILPGDMSGIQLLQTARQVTPQVGAIVMTGFPSAETTVEALRLGAFDYLTKPFDLGRMSSLLTQLMARQRQERRTADTLRQLESISRCTRIGIYSLDLSGISTYWGCSGLLGYAAEEMIGRRTPSAFVRTPHFDVASELDVCRRAGSTLGEHQVQRKDGHLLTIRTKLLPLFDLAHRPIGYAGYLMDISEERRLQDSQQGLLLEMEGRLGEQQRLVEAFQSVQTVVREGGRISDLVTRGLTGALGTVAGARSAWCFLREGVGEGLRVIAVEGGGEVFLGGAAHTAADPRVSASSLCDAATCDCLRALSGRQALPLAPDWVRCRRLAVAAVSGAEPPGHLALPLVFRGEVIGILNLAKEGCGPFTSEETDRLSMLADALASAIATTRLAREADETALRGPETRQRTDRTERLRVVGELASGVAHDFNNLLTVILGSTQLLLGAEEDPHRREELHTIRRATLDGAETVRRILEYTRVSRDRHTSRVNLPEVIQESVELTRSRWKSAAQARGATIEVRLTLAPIPAILGSPSELREMFTNLILNAVDAMPQGGQLCVETRPVTDDLRDPSARPVEETPRVVFRDGVPGTPAVETPGYPVASWIEVTMSDTGAGVAPEIVDRIFEPFFSTKEGTGIGLGLAVVADIVGRHRGRIAVRSAPGQGTTFTIRIPAAPLEGLRSMEGGLAHADRGDAPVAAYPSGRTARILIVDDEPKLAQLLRSFLEMQGHRVWTTTSGADAIALLGTRPFDLLLTDLGMPEVSGWDVAQEARRFRPELPVIMVSGWGAQIDPQQVAESGVAEVIQKPYTFETISQVIESVLRQHPPTSAESR